MKGKIALTALCAVMALGGTTAIAQVPVGRATGHVRPMNRERHQIIVRGIKMLMRTRAVLNHGNHDFGGHRVQAIAEIDQALAQLRMALKYDRH